MKDVILVTDIGVDCDDAAALGLLLNYHNQKKCNILAIATSTTREGATATIKLICDYYGVKVPIGRMYQPILPCDKKNVFTYDIKEKYGIDDVSQDNVSVIRKALAGAKDKVTLIEIGPLTSFAQVINSNADEYSSLDGISLLKEKVDKVYSMGGSFAQNFMGSEKQPKPEWNIYQDVDSARCVVEKCPCEILFLPFELGANVATEMGKGDNPVWECMKIFAIKDNKDVETFRRSSWDPITCMLAIERDCDFYGLSGLGKVSVADDGFTTFEPDGRGKHRIFLKKSDFDTISKYLNTLIEKK